MCGCAVIRAQFYSSAVTPLLPDSVPKPVPVVNVNPVMAPLESLSNSALSLNPVATNLVSDSGTIVNVCGRWLPSLTISVGRRP
jgi:hypothetical protein